MSIINSTPLSIQVNLINKQQRISKIAQLNSLYPRPRRSHQHIPQQYHSPISNKKQIFPSATQQIRISDSVLLSQQNNIRVIGFILYFLLLVLTIAESKLIIYVGYPMPCLQILIRILSGQVLYYLILIITGSAQRLSPKQIWYQLTSRNKPLHHQDQSSKINIRINNNLSTMETFPISNNKRPLKSFLMLLLFICLLTITYLAYAFSIKQQLSWGSILFSVSIFPVVVQKFKYQLLSIKCLIIVYILLILCLICSQNIVLFVLGLTLSFINGYTRSDAMTWTFGYYLRIIFLLVMLIFFTTYNWSIWSALIFVSEICLIVSGMLITRYISDQCLRKQLYRYYFPDWFIDCSLCLVPIIIMCIFHPFQYFLCSGCILLLILSYFYRHDTTVYLQTTDVLQTNKKSNLMQY